MEAARLTEFEIGQATDVLPEEFRQAHRLVQFLGMNPKTNAAVVRSNCEVGNISDVAKKANVFLEPISLLISCECPAQPLRLQIDKHNSRFLWGMYWLPHKLTA